MAKRLASILAFAALALAVLAACSTSGDTDAGGGAAETGGAVVDAASSGGEADEAGGAVPAAAPGLPSVETRVIRTASVELTLARGRYEDALAGARALAARFGGIVVSSDTVRAARERPLRGSVTIRVPSSRYADAMVAVGRLGTVEAATEASEDVSAEYVDLESRARHLEAVERQLLELLDRADTVPAALAVQGQLNDVQLQLEQARGRIRFLDDQTAYATISIELRERGDTEAETGWGIRDAWGDGLHAFVRVLAGAFVVVATVAPLLALAALAFLGFRFVRKRRLGLAARG